MVVTDVGKSLASNSIDYNRLQEFKEFDESKASVKDIVDAGITKIPRMFVRSPEDIAGDEPTNTQFTIPVIDLSDLVHRRIEVVEEVRCAAEVLGFFQVVNHGIPERVLEEMLEAARGFHELPRDVKVEYYSREETGKVQYVSNLRLYKSSFAMWHDTLFCIMGPKPLDPQDLPLICRDKTIEYSKQAHKLGITLFELLSEALGLKSDHLIGMDCAKRHSLISHYYPPCPEPELTLGSMKHSDPSFITILLQDQIGGLQVLHQNQWSNVLPMHGALVVNLGDIL